MANNPLGSPSDTMSDAIPSVGDVASRVQETASALGTKVSGFAHDAVDAIDARRGAAAGGLQSAAAGLHTNAGRLPAKLSQFAHDAADKMSVTADYVRGHTMQDALADLNRYVTAHPAQALLGAAVVGFFAGRVLSRK